uniref:Uncharacterized protein n=1 Tax=Rhizophora mucronata TaxID=61149 RepID=A0A2P2IQU4_RHIMU
MDTCFATSHCTWPLLKERRTDRHNCSYNMHIK